MSTGLPCPVCTHADSRVLDTSATSAGIRRRRQCLRCGHRHTTVELPAEQINQDRELLRRVRSIVSPTTAS
jgi:transcriptional regulator NrdR family protein